MSDLRHPIHLCLVLMFAATLGAQETVTVFAAASLTTAVKELGTTYEKSTGVRVVASFAAASTLAKQIENGAPADVFISADAAWMEYLVAANQLRGGSRIDLLGNRLVLIAPKDHPFSATMSKDFAIGSAFSGRWAVGDPASVPIGRYAKEAFTTLGWWPVLKDRVAATADVRAALRLVESAEVDAGVVYATDAAASTTVVVVAPIPSELHKPVVYPLALTVRATPAATAFATYLAGAQAKAVFTRLGFTWLPPSP